MENDDGEIKEEQETEECLQLLDEVEKLNAQNQQSLQEILEREECLSRLTDLWIGGNFRHIVSE